MPKWIFQKISRDQQGVSLFEKIVLVISKILQILGLQPRISNFFTVGQNNFGNKIPILSFFLVLKSINRNAYALTNNLVADNITEDLQQANIERDKLLEEEKKKTEAEKAKSGKYSYFIFIYVFISFIIIFSFYLEEEKKRAENEKEKNGK